MTSEADRTRLERDVRALCESADFDAATTIALRAYGGEIFSFLVAVHRDELVASDVFSVFAEGLWQSLPSFEWNATLRTWAYAIARNASRMAQRSAARRERRAPRAGDSALEGVAEAVRTETLEYLRTETRSKLEVLRDALSQEDRALLALRVDRGLSWNDVARVFVGADAPSDEAVQREAGRLRKRFQVVKDRLRDLAKREGLR